MSSLVPRLGAGLHQAADLSAGYTFAQPILESGVPLDEVVGSNFAVIGDRHLLDSVSPATQALWDINGVVRVPDEAQPYLDELNARAVIIRPDRYILAVANSTESLDHVSTYLPGGNANEY